MIISGVTPSGRLGKSTAFPDIWGRHLLSFKINVKTQPPMPDSPALYILFAR